MEPHILLVDDEAAICKIVERFLGQEGYRVHSVGDGAAMRDRLAVQPMDLVILDVRLPGEDGFSLARELRRLSTVPILMLTSQDDVIDRVAGLESGADDYMPKPFHPRELLARVRALLRRTQMLSAVVSAVVPTAEAVLCFGGWRLDCATHQLFSPQQQEVLLSPAEYDLLCVFLHHPHRVLSREFLLDQTRGRSAAPFDRAIDVHISHLRKKLEPNPKQPTLIKTVRNAGYRLTVAVMKI